MVQSAAATAMMAKAQAQATAMIQTANAPVMAPSTTPVPTEPSPAPVELSEGDPPVASDTSTGLTPIITGDPDEVHLLGVTFGAEGNFIVVEFKTSPKIANTWTYGNVYVIDEASGIKYDQIPVMPVIGPLFSKPKILGQIGNVMLYNINGGLKSGAIVTVVLGNFKQEHVLVK